MSLRIEQFSKLDKPHIISSSTIQSVNRFIERSSPWDNGGLKAFLANESRHDYQSISEDEKEVLLTICAWLRFKDYAKDQLRDSVRIAELIFGSFDQTQITEVISGRRDPASAILMISALMTAHEMYKARGKRNVPERVKAWGHLHDFVELNNRPQLTDLEWGGQYLTHWHMRCSILRGFPEAGDGYRHPDLCRDPPCCQDGESHEMPCATEITDEYWTRILGYGESHGELWPDIHSHLESRREDKNVPCPVYCRYTTRTQL